MEKLVEIGILFDYYGKLLSERQYDAIELYYIYDLSLSEIGEELDISRQAVYDSLKRGEENLKNYEASLNLVKRTELRLDYLEKIEKLAEEIECLESLDTVREKSKEIKNIVNSLLIKSSQEVVE